MKLQLRFEQIRNNVLMAGLLLSGVLAAQNNPTFAWMKNVAWGANDQYITSFDDDNQGNLFSGGMLRTQPGTTYFNNGDSIIITQGFRGFLSKMDNNGVAIWAKPFPQSSQNGVSKVFVSPSQKLFVASQTDGGVTIDGVSIPTQSVILFKYDLNGVLQNHVEFPCSNNFFRVDNIAVDQNDNAYIVGFFNGTLTVGTTSLTNGGTFHIKVDSSGNVKWAKKFSGRTWDVKVASDGNVLIAGNCPSSASFGSFNAGSTGYQLPFLVKLDSASGNPIFLHTPSSFHGGEARAIIQDGNDNIYIGGLFGKSSGSTTNSNLNFGNFTLSPVGGHFSGFVAKYNSAGVPLWGKAMGGGDYYGHAHEMVISDSIIVIRGEMAPTCLFPNANDTITIRTKDNASYFARIDTSGKWLSARATSFSNSNMSDFLQTNTGSLYFAGYFSSSSYLYNDGQDSIVNRGSRDAVIAKLNDISTVVVNAPSNLQVTGHGSNGWNATTHLGWTDNSTNEYGFFASVSRNGASTGSKVQVGANVTNGTVGFLWNGLVYDYQVHSILFDMLSEPSNIVTDTAVFVGVTENLLEKVTLKSYPNPSTGLYNLNSDNEIASVELYDVLGKKVYSEIVNNKQVQLQLNGLTKGIYIVNVIFNQGVLSKKLILE